MRNRKWIVTIAIILLVGTLWLGVLLPRQIARIAGTAYVKEHFPQMELECTGVEWANVYGSYLITFSDGADKTYSCVIGPQMFPVSLGQGLFAIESDYSENYK